MLPATRSSTRRMVFIQTPKAIRPWHKMSSKSWSRCYRKVETLNPLIPLYLYTLIPLYLYTFIPDTHHHIPIPLYPYIPISLYTYIPIYLYTYILILSPYRTTNLNTAFPSRWTTDT